MNRLTKVALICIAASLSAHATVLFSEDFESYTAGTATPFAAGGNWAVNGSGDVVTDPFSGGFGNVLNFDSEGSGGDLWSILIPYVPATNNELRLEFDIALHFPLPNSGPYAFIGQDSDTSGGGTELWTLGSTLTGFYEDPANGGPYVSDPSHVADTWYHISLNFFPFQDTDFYLKLESSANQAYFDNITLTDNVPEPGTIATFCGGLALLGLLRKYRAS